MVHTRNTAIVTGASRGIGAGLVAAFQRRGYNVVANSQTHQRPFLLRRGRREEQTIKKQIMKAENYAATKTAEIRLARRSPEYWRVTVDHPPLNIFGPEMLPQVNEIITALETDEQVKVVVFDSAVEGFFLIHLDFLANLDGLTRLPPGPRRRSGR